jgi:elongator complex protein 4
LFGRYFLAEGVARGHRLCWVRASCGRRRRRLLDGDDADVDDLRAFIPRRVEGKTTGGDDDDDEGEDAEDERKADDGLRIAWQYRRYLKEGRALDDSRVGTSQFIRGGNSGDGGSEAAGMAKKTRKKSLRAPDMCASYDLTREEDASRLEGVDLTTARLWNDDDDDDDDDVSVNSWAKCYAFVRDFIRETNAKGDATIGRVLVQPETPTDDAEWAECASLVSALKSLVYGTNVVLMFVLPLINAPERVGALIRHSVDCAIDVQPLEGPTSEIESLLPEPQTCVGLVAVRKLQFQGAVVSPLSRMDRVYALQVRRKRMAIKPLQIRPEEEATKKDTKSACGTASAAGLDDF